MKGIEKIFPAIAFMIAIACTLATKADVNQLTVVTASTYTPGNTPTCVVVGKCEKVGNSVCTDINGNQLREYNSKYGTCLSYALGIFIETDE
jgi:hypothetical protein